MQKFKDTLKIFESFKVFYNTKSEEIKKEFDTEIEANRKVFRILGSPYTTLVDNFMGIYLELKNSITITIKNNMYIETYIYLIPQTLCIGDLKSIKNIEINIQSVYDNISSAVKELHKKGYVHRDIKEENIVKCGDTYKLIDYGFCAEANTITDGDLYGTPGYFHPYLYQSIDDNDGDKIINNSTFFFKAIYNQNHAINLKTPKQIKQFEAIKWFKSDEYALAHVIYNLYKNLYKNLSKKEKEPINKYLREIIKKLCDPRMRYLIDSGRNVLDGGDVIKALHKKYC